MPAAKNPKVDAYLAKAKNWQPELTKLRAIALSCGLTEDLKWGKPCYTQDGNNVVLLIGLKNHCMLMFFKGALLKDAKKLLIKAGENTQAMRQMRFASVQEIARA